MKPAAFVRVESADAAALKVGGIGVLDRLVVGLHRAGCDEITLAVDGSIPDLPRARAHGVRMRIVNADAAPELPALLARAELLVHADDLRAVAEQRARLVGLGGENLPAGFANVWRGDIQTSIADAPRVTAARTATIVDSARAARTAEPRFWAALDGAADSLVDGHFNRPLGRPLAKRLARTSVTPNVISAFATLIGLSSAWLFAHGTPAASVLAAIVFQLAAVVDCVDGDVARAACKETPAGKWVDLIGDQIVHVALFAGIAVGLGRAGSTAPALALAASAAVGTLCAFIVVCLAPAASTARRSGTQRRSSALHARRRSPAQHAIAALTNRDFSVLLILLALLRRLDIFLWGAAIGVHVFWTFALAAEIAARRRKPTRASV